MPNFLLALVCDLIVLFVCATFLILYGRLSALHPAPTYLLYHAWTVTLRLAALASGSQIGLGHVMRNPPNPEELIRAAFAFDLALVVVTLVWLYLARRERGAVSKGRRLDSPRRTIRFSLPYLKGVAALSIAVGLVSLWYLRFAGAGVVAEHVAGLGEWSGSAWVYMTATWALQGFAMLHYSRGFPLTLTALTVLVFLLTVLGNAERYALIVWFVFCVFTYLSIRGKRWPNLRIAMFAALIAVAWFPLKTVVASFWAGDDSTTILTKAKAYTEASLGPGGHGGDTTFLDASALHMALVDQHGSYFYGSTLLPLLTLPIPRPWWPAKPSTFGWAWTISRPDRPVAEDGMVPGIVGEGYVNFGYLGVVLFPMLAAYLYGAGYFYAIRYPHRSIQRFAYLVSACVLIQVFRDGLVSVVAFTLAYAMPMTFVLYMHWFFPPKFTPRRFRAVSRTGMRPRSLSGKTC